LDATLSKPGDGPTKKTACCRPLLVLKDFDISKARSIIDAYVDELPAYPSSPFGLVICDSVANSTDSAKFLDI
jgi:hypothetical protein